MEKSHTAEKLWLRNVRSRARNRGKIEASLAPMHLRVFSLPSASWALCNHANLNMIVVYFGATKRDSE